MVLTKPKKIQINIVYIFKIQKFDGFKKVLISYRQATGMS